MHLAKEIYFRFRENREGENIISHIHSILRFMHFEFYLLYATVKWPSRCPFFVLDDL